MITGSLATVDTLSWQEELARSIRDPKQLLEALNLDLSSFSRSEIGSSETASADFALRVPLPYLNRIRKGDINDPLLKQVLPTGDELIVSPGYKSDPVGDQLSNPIPGLIHKYQGRVLLIVSPNCAINCRYCFRRHFDYQENKPNRQQWHKALDYIANDKSITEVIFSGGDPLAVGDKQLAWLTNQIAAIDHIQRLRVHTRLPIVIPTRITPSCLNWLTSTRLKPVMVIHSNHVNELGSDVHRALNKLTDANVTLLNQTVLLKGVNDSAKTLCDLSETLFSVGVLPYYLHLLDQVQGAAHFEVSETNAIQLHQQLMAQLPGYLVPKLVREIAGQANKTPIL